MGSQEFGISHEALFHLSEKIYELQNQDFKVGVVMGGGNMFRGVQQGSSLGLERTPADQIGMLATMMNGLALTSALKKSGCKARMLSALDCPKITESYQWNRMNDYFEEGEVVLFVGGTGHPFFTTDTTAALRANEMQADILLKATTHVDGVFDKDPRKYPDAKPFTEISFLEVIERRLGIMDLSAVTMCMQAQIPIRVFNYHKVSLIDALSDKPIGTLIKE